MEDLKNLSVAILYITLAVVILTYAGYVIGTGLGSIRRLAEQFDRDHAQADRDHQIRTREVGAKERENELWEQQLKRGETRDWVGG